MGTKKSEILSGDKVQRLKDRKYLKWVSEQSCLLCLTHPCQAHHLTFAMPRGFSQKTGDQWTIPVCYIHHSQIHNYYKGEKQFWKRLDIDAESIACTLYQHHLDQKKSLDFFVDDTILWNKVYYNLVPKLKKHVDFLVQLKL